MSSYLAGLSLRDFRNYEQQQLQFHPRLNIICGENGQGKTSLLEAIGFLSLLRSIRRSPNRLLRRSGSGGFHLQGFLKQEGMPDIDLEIINSGDSRRTLINGEPVRQASEFISTYRAVACVPEDIAVIKGSPSDRRLFIDLLLTQLSRSYLNDLKQFHEALRQRNALLKQMQQRSDSSMESMLDYWDGHFLEFSTRVIVARRYWMQRLETFLNDCAKRLFPEGSELGLRYVSAALRGLDADADAVAIQQNLSQRMQSSRDRDRRFAQTHEGPQRDDLQLLLQGKLLQQYGSEGQCRLASLVLKMASAALLVDEEELQGQVVLLIDDVIGELDESRRAAFFEGIDDSCQIFIACTEIPKYFADAESSLFEVKQGVVEQLN